MKLKIGRNEYEITSKDEFMDNGACVQLITQSKERSIWGHRANPVLSKKAIKQISCYDRIKHDRESRFHASVVVFSLKLEGETS